MKIKKVVASPNKAQEKDAHRGLLFKDIRWRFIRFNAFIFNKESKQKKKQLESILEQSKKHNDMLLLKSLEDDLRQPETDDSVELLGNNSNFNHNINNYIDPYVTMQAIHNMKLFNGDEDVEFEVIRGPSTTKPIYPINNAELLKERPSPAPKTPSSPKTPIIPKPPSLNQNRTIYDNPFTRKFSMDYTPTTVTTETKHRSPIELEEQIKHLDISKNFKMYI